MLRTACATLALAGITLGGCGENTDKTSSPTDAQEVHQTVAHKTDKPGGQKWRDKLTPEQYRVTQQCGTERAFTGKYWNNKEPGVYRCVVLWRGAVQLKDQVRLRQRLAEFLRTDGRQERGGTR